AISDVLYRYAAGLDTKNWELYRSVFTDEIVMNYSSTGDEPQTWSADDWVEHWRPQFTGFDATQHISTNHTIDIRGDEATCVSYMRAIHLLQNTMGENHWTMGGYYTNELVRTADGWKLCAVTLTTTWTQGNRHVMTLARERGREILGLA